MKPKFSRRQVLKGGAALTTGLALAGAGKRGLADDGVIKVGFLAALTGEAAGWGLPGLYGVEIWVEQLNAAGGINVGGKPYKVEVVSYDDEFDTTKALTGAKKLIFEDGVKFIEMLGGAPVQGTQDFMTQNEMLVSTLAPADMTPDTPYLLAPVEVHPIYNVTGVDWVARNWPDVKTVAIATQNDEIGLSSLATYRAAFEVTGIEIVEEKLFGFDVVDFAPIISALLAKKPDLLCWDTAYPDYVNLMTEQAHLQGFQGKFVSCTLDQYQNVIDKTSKEFIEGYIFQFPDFDDPMMQGSDVNFANAAEFYRIYNERYPGAWNAVSWEYAGILEMWKRGIEAAGSFEPMDVFQQLKSWDTVPHVYGPAKWWGKDFFGVDNAPIGRWPVVQMQNGKAKILELANIMAWLDQHQDVLYRHFKELNMV